MRNSWIISYTLDILGCKYLICSRPDWYGVPVIFARMHLRDPRKDILPLPLELYIGIISESLLFVCHAQGKATGNSILYSLFPFHVELASSLSSLHQYPGSAPLTSHPCLEKPCLLNAIA